MTNAASDALYYLGDPVTNEWCGYGCGVCYELTPTGGYVPGQGSAPSNTEPVITMVTNMCPSEANTVWCTIPNQFGYTAHFDMMNGEYKLPGWNNPEVYYKRVPCTGLQASLYTQCECY
jgi:hypothetical protein